jgi:methylmalonyl-CoA mutase
LRLFSLRDLAALLGDAEWPPLALDAGALALPVGLALIAFARRHGTRLSAELYCDPLAALANTGALAGGMEGALRALCELARFAAALDMNVASVGVDTRVYHLAGASEAQEIALALATGAHYLRALEASGLSLAQALPQLRFIFATDSRFFRALCKLRAFRLCWAQLTEACGAREDLRGAGIWAETSFRDLARRDPHVNSLRGVAGCFAAALGQADAISVRPFDEAYAVPSLFARRLARNTSHLFAEEGGLARVLDPAGGSWALESMTEAMAEKGWTIFQELERAGGMEKALASGKVAAMLAETAKARAERVASGVLPLTGVTLFPDAEEPSQGSTPIDWVRLAREEEARRPPPLSAAQAKRLRPGAKDRIAAALDALGEGASFESVGLALAGEGCVTVTPLPQARLAAPFEGAEWGARAT